MNCCAASSFLARIKKSSPAQKVATIRGPTKGARLSATTGRINASVMKTPNDKAANRVTEYVPILFFIEELGSPVHRQLFTYQRVRSTVPMSINRENALGTQF